jgi:hypothetical protein
MMKTWGPVSIAALICTCAAYPQAKGTAVVINGRLIPSRVISGQVFVKAEDVAIATDATMSQSHEGITLTTTPSGGSHTQCPETAVPIESHAVNYGTIRGTLSYYFNRNYGNKADTGSKVYLLAGQIIISPNSLLTAVGTSATGWQLKVAEREPSGAYGPWRDFQLVKHTVSDGVGNFELAGVPEGSYTIIIESNHVENSSYAPKLWTTASTIRANDTFDASWDFGISQ